MTMRTRGVIGSHTICEVSLWRKYRLCHCHYYYIIIYLRYHFLWDGHGYFMSLYCAAYYFRGWLCLRMTSSVTLLILCIHVGLNHLFSEFKFVYDTNSVITSCSITISEFRFLYMNCWNTWCTGSPKGQTTRSYSVNNSCTETGIQI